MSKDSVTEQDVKDDTGQMLDSWAWVLRARAAARRAIEPATPQPEADEIDAEPRRSVLG